MPYSIQSYHDDKGATDTALSGFANKIHLLIHRWFSKLHIYAHCSDRSTIVSYQLYTSVGEFDTSVLFPLRRRLQFY